MELSEFRCQLVGLRKLIVTHRVERAHEEMDVRLASVSAPNDELWSKVWDPLMDHLHSYIFGPHDGQDIFALSDLNIGKLSSSQEDSGEIALWRRTTALCHPFAQS